MNENEWEDLVAVDEEHGILLVTRHKSRITRIRQPIDIDLQPIDVDQGIYNTEN